MGPKTSVRWRDLPPDYGVSSVGPPLRWGETGALTAASLRPSARLVKEDVIDLSECNMEARLRRRDWGTCRPYQARRRHQDRGNSHLWKSSHRDCDSYRQSLRDRVSTADRPPNRGCKNLKVPPCYSVFPYVPAYPERLRLPDFPPKPSCFNALGLAS